MRQRAAEITAAQGLSGDPLDARATWPALIGALIKGETLTADETAWR